MIRIFFSFYIDKNKDRQNELETCISKNIPLFNEIIVFADDEEAANRLITLGILNITILPTPTFSDYFKKINSIVDKDDISIIANTDIYFLKQSIEQIKTLKDNEVFALCRYNEDEYNNISFFNRQDSQDVWCFKGKINSTLIEHSDFKLGVAGCDNRIAFEIKRTGLDISNPSLDIITIHLHNSNIRNYIINKIPPIPPPYFILPPKYLTNGKYF